jgi:hypothetical protein
MKQENKAVGRLTRFTGVSQVQDMNNLFTFWLSFKILQMGS